MTTDNVSTLAEVLQALEQSPEPLAPYKALEAIASVRPINLPTPMEMQSELIAFRLLEELERSVTSESECYALPNDTTVSEAMLDYWKLRAAASSHPVMKALYADLVWDLSRRIARKWATVSFARMAIDGFLKGARARKLEYEHPIFSILSRALALSMSIRDSERIADAIQAILDFEDAVGEDQTPGLWGHAYDLLLKNKSVPITEDKRKKIIADLESRLSRTADANAKTFAPWSAEYAAALLADYYRRLDKRADLERVLRAYVASFQALCKQGSPLQQQAWLKRAHQVLVQFGMSTDAQQIVVQLRQIGRSVKNDMKQMKIEIPLEADKMRKYIEAMTEGDLQTVLHRIAGRFIPLRDKIVEQAKNSGLIAQIFTTTIQDNTGRPVASVGNVSDDMDGQIVMQMSQHISRQSLFLGAVLDAARACIPLTPEQMTDFVMGSAVLTEEDKPLILSGLKSYFDDRHVDAIHVLVPRIETAIRALHDISGAPVMRPNRHGGFDLLLLGELLRTAVAEQALTPAIALYFRVLLVDPRGWNIRNSVCHGLTDAEHFTRAVSDRLIHVLLILANIQEAPTPSKV